MKKTFFGIGVILLFLGFSGCGRDDDPNLGGNTNSTKVYDLKLPYINVNTNGQTIIDEPKRRASMQIVDIDDEENEKVVFNGFIGIELRGSSSQALFEKKSYGVETQDEGGLDLDTMLFDFPTEEDWIFYGPYSDKTLMRNKLIFDLANELDAYASQTKYFELFINNDYKGLYVLMEKIKRDKNRVDISKLNPDENAGEDLTGGYIIKIDKASGNGNQSTEYNSSNSFPSSYDVNGNMSALSRTNYLYDYPDKDVITDAQKAYIQNYFDAFEKALLSPEFMDPNLGYRQYINVESFIDYLIFNEFAHNPDAYRLSTFLFKDKNDKLNIGPIWDFNLAFGNMEFCQGGEYDNWIMNYNNYCPNDFWLINFWWKRLLSDPQFVLQLNERYEELRSSTLSLSNIYSKIDGYADRLKNSGAVDRNFNEYRIMGQKVWPNKFVGQNYEFEVGYLKDWISNRLEWMDANIADL